jgi:hypothetical protein
MISNYSNREPVRKIRRKNDAHSPRLRIASLHASSGKDKPYWFRISYTRVMPPSIMTIWPVM